MLRRVALVRTDDSEELSASFFRVARIGELGTTLAVTSNRRVRRLLVTTSVVPSSPILVTLMEALSSCETQILIRTTRRNIPEDTIRLLWSSQVNSLIHNSPPQDSIISQTNPVHTLLSLSFKINCNAIRLCTFRLPSRLFLSGFLIAILYALFISHARSYAFQTILWSFMKKVYIQRSQLRQY
jgi:hypothetical protein